MNKLIANVISSLVFNKSKRRAIRDILLDRNQTASDIKLKRAIYLALTICNTHKQTFEEYKNAFSGQDIVLCGSGPSLNKYSPTPSVIHIGTNRVHQKIKLDFLFRQDFKSFDKEIFQTNVNKFIGNYYDWHLDMCPESVFNQLSNARKYIIDNDLSAIIPVDLTSQPLWHGGSVIFSAFQFALWTNPRRIYLVGCDCAGQVHSKLWNHFDDKDITNQNTEPIQALVNGWKQLKYFSDCIYPYTEIISVNPVGLKGMFKDTYI